MADLVATVEPPPAVLGDCDHGGKPQLQFLGPIVLQALLQDLDDLRAVPAVAENPETKAQSPLVLGVALPQLGRLVLAPLVPREGGHALSPLPDSGVRV